MLCVNFLQESHLLLSENDSIESARVLALATYRIVLESMSRILSLIQLHLHKRHIDWISSKSFNKFLFSQRLPKIILNVLRFEYSLLIQTIEDFDETEDQLSPEISPLDLFLIRFFDQLFETIRDPDLQFQFKCYLCRSVSSSFERRQKKNKAEETSLYKFARCSKILFWLQRETEFRVHSLSGICRATFTEKLVQPRTDSLRGFAKSDFLKEFISYRLFE